MLKPDRESAAMIEALIVAYKSRDAERCTELMDEIVTTKRDAYLLMLTLASTAARPLSVAHRTLHTDVQLHINQDPGAHRAAPAVMALQLTTIIANDQHQTAQAMARVALTNGPDFVEDVLISLLQILDNGTELRVLIGERGQEN